MTLFLSDNALQCFARQIVSFLHEDTNHLYDSEYILYLQELRNGQQLGKDMDILLGFTTNDPHPAKITIHISDVDVATKNVVKSEFVSALHEGQCIPISSLENYRVSFDIFPENATVICFIGRLRNIYKRLQIKDRAWKYICMDRKFFLVKCSQLQIQHITHVHDFIDIPSLPNIQQHVDQSVEEWKKQKCQQMVDTILENLIEKTWHPSRHIDWCLDNDEKESLGLPTT